MLDLKAKLLAAGLVSADQVKRVEDEEAERKRRAKEARERKERERQAPPRSASKGARERKDDDDPDEKRARREHEWNEAQRWRQRLDALKAAGKSEQYDAMRGWVMRDRLDNRQITDAAVRFHFVKDDGAVAHLTVEPDVKEQLTAGTAAVVAFMGFNGIEHAVVPRDVADDLRVVRPDWLRHMVGVTDVMAAAEASTSSTESPSASSAETSAETSSETSSTETSSTEAP